MKLPNIKDFYSTNEYFTQLYNINKANRKTFSHRVFARKLKWPASFLPDLIKCRKKLTITRAIQFSTVFKLTPAETEYLLIMCLSEYDDSHVSEHFKIVLKNRNLPKEKQMNFKKYLGLFDNIRGMYLRELILWGQGKVPLKELLAAQIPFPELRESSVLDETLKFLLNRKLIKQKATDVFILTEGDMFALDDREFTENRPQALANHYIRQLEVLGRLYKRYTGHGFSFSGYIDVRKERYQELRKRMNELRDWIISLSQEKKSSNIYENETFQVELHGVPLFDFNEIKPKMNDERGPILHIDI